MRCRHPQLPVQEAKNNDDISKELNGEKKSETSQNIDDEDGDDDESTNDENLIQTIFTK